MNLVQAIVIMINCNEEKFGSDTADCLHRGMADPPPPITNKNRAVGRLHAAATKFRYTHHAQQKPDKTLNITLDI